MERRSESPRACLQPFGDPILKWTQPGPSGLLEKGKIRFAKCLSSRIKWPHPRGREWL